jgi:hypothetical protein
VATRYTLHVSFHFRIRMDFSSAGNPLNAARIPHANVLSFIATNEMGVRNGGRRGNREGG